MKNLSRKEFLKIVARKRVSAGVIFLNNKKQILLVKTSYKKYWSLPGGMIDKNESPKDAAIREAEEEIGIKVKNLKLGSIGWGMEKEYDDDYITFQFNGGIIEDEKSIRIDNEEIIDFKFADVNKIKNLVSPGTNAGIIESLRNLKTENSIYIEVE
jgi:8-oxo-dGTP pyrophosphatase MutT (NUDIX family)